MFINSTQMIQQVRKHDFVTGSGSTIFTPNSDLLLHTRFWWDPPTNHTTTSSKRCPPIYTEILGISAPGLAVPVERAVTGLSSCWQKKKHYFHAFGQTELRGIPWYPESRGQIEWLCAAWNPGFLAGCSHFVLAVAADCEHWGWRDEMSAAVWIALSRGGRTSQVESSNILYTELLYTMSKLRHPEQI